MRAYADTHRLGRAAERIWAEGRPNPIDWQVRTALGAFSTTDRATWRTDSGEWTAELRRSRKGQHWYLALFEGGQYRGRYDGHGWSDATDRRRVHRVRPTQLPLAA